MDAEIPSKLCGRPFGEAEPERIRRAIVRANPSRRAEIARWVYRALDWTGALGPHASYRPARRYRYMPRRLTL
jgi:hypothetical protein